MKIKRQIINLINSTKTVRKARVKKRGDAVVQIESMMNYEQACAENVAALHAHDNGLLYMGRFGGVKHNFACIDREKLFAHLATLDDCVISIRSRGAYHKAIKIAALSTFRNAIGHIDIYRQYVTPNGATVFGHREAARIHMPFERGDHLRLEKVNPVARKIMLDGSEPLIDIDVSGLTFKTSEKFATYIAHSPTENKQIDLVYTWVDGLDPEWAERKAQYSPNVSVEESHASASSSSRFKHVDELLYSIRSVFMYTNFVRHIYIVTDQQVPSWFKESDVVTIVDHRNIFPDDSVLPTFNSHAIESCLHRIPGLSEHFLYLNDDLMFGRSVTLDQFFTHRMRPRINYSNQAFIPMGDASPEDLPVDSAAKNARALFLKNYGEWITRKFKHVPCPVSRHDAEQLEAMLQPQIDETRSKRFRTFRDLSFLTCAYYHYMAINEKSGAGELRYGYVDVNSTVDLYRLRSNLVKTTARRWDVFCLNDVDGEGTELTKRVAKSVLNDVYPFQADCEKEGLSF